MHLWSIEECTYGTWFGNRIKNDTCNECKMQSCNALKLKSITGIREGSVEGRNYPRVYYI